MTIAKTAQSTSWLSVRTFMFTPLGSFVKSRCEQEPHQNSNAKNNYVYFFSLLVTERMNQTTDVKAPEPKSPEQTNPAVDMRLQCSARLNCCFFSMESGEKSISVWTLPIMLLNTYSNNLTIYFANSKNLLYAFVIQTPRFV